MSFLRPNSTLFFRYSIVNASLTRK